MSVMNPSLPVANVTSDMQKPVHTPGLSVWSCYTRGSDGSYIFALGATVYRNGVAVYTFPTYSGTVFPSAHGDWVYASVYAGCVLVAGNGMQLTFKLLAYNAVTGTAVTIDTQTKNCYGASGAAIRDVAGQNIYGQGQISVDPKTGVGLAYAAGYREAEIDVFLTIIWIHCVASAFCLWSFNLGTVSSNPSARTFLESGAQYNQTGGAYIYVYGYSAFMGVYNNVGFFQKSVMGMTWGYPWFSGSVLYYDANKVTNLTSGTIVNIEGNQTVQKYVVGPGINGTGTSIKNFDRSITWTVPSGNYRGFLGENATHYFIMGYGGSVKNAPILALPKAGGAITSYAVNIYGNAGAGADKNYATQVLGDLPLAHFTWTSYGWQELTIPLGESI